MTDNGAREGARRIEPGKAAADDHDLRDRPSFVHDDDEMILRFRAAFSYEILASRPQNGLS